jgi:Lon protease-like protein
MTLLRVPIYPSEQVLFPGQILPLTGEVDQLPRMLRFCQEQRRQLGVVYIPGERGHALARVGTLSHLLSIEETEDWPGDAQLVVGSGRFKILQLHQDRAFLEATIQLWPWREEPEPSWRMVECVGDYLHRYAQAISDLMPPALMPDLLKPDTATLGVLAAALLHISAADKEVLLELPSSEALLRAVLRHLRLHVPLAERLASMPPPGAGVYERILLN